MESVAGGVVGLSLPQENDASSASRRARPVLVDRAGPLQFVAKMAEFTRPPQSDALLRFAALNQMSERSLKRVKVLIRNRKVNPPDIQQPNRLNRIRKESRNLF